MSQAGYTPIQLYYSTTTGNIPSASNLALGEIALNIADAKLFYKTSGGVVQVLAATDVELKVYNNTGSTIAQGAAVYLSGGASGQTPYISLAIATSQAAANVIGLTTAAITTGSTGYVTTVGLSSTFNTSSFTAGDTVYLSAVTAGALTVTAPSAPNYAVRVGFVAYANATGNIFVTKSDFYTSASSLIGTVVTTNGGTGVSSWTAGQIPYYSSGTSLSQLPIGTNGQFLTSSGTAPQWSTVTYVSSFSAGTTGLTPSTTTTGAVTLAGTLIAANGGTGQSSYTVGDILAASTTTALSKVSPGTAGQLLTSAGPSTLPTWTALTSVALTTGTITAAPINGTDIVNKTYADSIASGINYHPSCSYATTAALPANTYNNGTSGVGATLTANANGTLTIDGYTFVSGDVGKRILVKNESTQANNGVYTLTQAGTGGLPYILTRATDFDSSGTGVDQIDAGDFLLIISGLINGNTSWVQQTQLPIIVGTTAIVFVQFAAVQTYTSGTGLTLSSNQFSITNTTVTAASYGAANSVATFTVNQQGQLTAAGSSSIAINGNQITSGTVSTTYGGTGLSSYTAGDTIYYSTGSALSKVSIGTAYQINAVNSGATAPSWQSLSSLIDNAFTASAQGTILYRGASTWTALAPGTSGYVLKTQGASADPLWGAIGGVTSFSAGTTGFSPSSTTAGAVTLSGTLNIANGGSGTTTAQLAMNAFAGAVTSGSYLRGDGTNVVMNTIQVTDVPTLNQNTSGYAASLAGGNATTLLGALPYQSAANTTSLLSPNITTTKNFLTQTGTGAAGAVPAWGTIAAADFGTTLAPQFGSLGVGVAASGTTGEIRGTDNVTAYYVSDIKFKENIKDIPNALETVKAIGGQLFDWKDEYIAERGGEDGYFIRKADFGHIAQKVQEHFPLGVRTKPDGTLAVDYQKMCALAFAAIQELDEKFETLRSKYDA